MKYVNICFFQATQENSGKNLLFAQRTFCYIYNLMRQNEMFNKCDLVIVDMFNSFSHTLCIKNHNYLQVTVDMDRGVNGDCALSQWMESGSDSGD